MADVHQRGLNRDCTVFPFLHTHQHSHVRIIQNNIIACYAIEQQR